MNAAKAAVIAAVLLGMIGGAPARAVAGLNVAPAKLNFGDVRAGTASTAKPFALSNPNSTNDAAATPQQAPLSGTAVITAQTALFVTNAVSSTVAVFPLSADGDVGPIGAIGDLFDLNFPEGVAVDSSGNIYVANTQDSSIIVYSVLPNGAVTPIAAIRGVKTKLKSPHGIALDSSGNVYVTNDAGRVTVYPPLGSSIGTLNEAPSATIAGAKTKLDSPQGIALDSSGNIYVTNIAGGSSNTGTVTIYSPQGSKTGTLDEPPIATIAGADTGLYNPLGIALDSSGNIYVANCASCRGGSGDRVVVYSPRGSRKGTLNEAPTAIITGADTGLNYPAGIALDSSGKIYVTNAGSDPSGSSVTVYPPQAGSTGTLNEAPIAMISGANTGLAFSFEFPAGIALDSSGKIYVANDQGGPSATGTVTVYSPLGSDTGTLDEMPTATLGNSDTGLYFPVAVAFDSSGSIYVANQSSLEGGSGVDSVTIYPAGTNGNVAPTATISGAGTGLASPASLALDASENIYVANDDLGGGSRSVSVTIYPPLGTSTGSLDASADSTRRTLSVARTLEIVRRDREGLFARLRWHASYLSGREKGQPLECRSGTGIEF